MKFRHKMIEEILQEPQVLETFLSTGLTQVEEAADFIVSKKYKMIYITGSGTSYHAGLAAQYAFSTLTQLVTSLIPASEFGSWIPSRPARKSLLIAISQSGESADVLAAAREGQSKGINVLAITNTENSSLMKLAEHTVLTKAGREFAVTATKSHSAQLMALFLLCSRLAEKEMVGPSVSTSLRKQLFNAPKIVDETINSVNDKVRQLAEAYRHQNFFFLLGSGPNFSTALEGALKLKEACNIFAEGFASREFLHGPIQLVDEKTSLFFLLTKDQMDNALQEIKNVRGFGSSVFSIYDGKDERLEAVTSESIQVPRGFPQVFSSLVYIIPLQLFAYYSSVARGLDPDKPEKLRKVVK